MSTPRHAPRWYVRGFIPLWVADGMLGQLCRHEVLSIRLQSLLELGMHQICQPVCRSYLVKWRMAQSPHWLAARCLYAAPGACAELAAALGTGAICRIAQMEHLGVVHSCSRTLPQSCWSLIPMSSSWHGNHMLLHNRLQEHCFVTQSPHGRDTPIVVPLCRSASSSSSTPSLRRSCRGGTGLRCI